MYACMHMHTLTLSFQKTKHIQLLEILQVGTNSTTENENLTLFLENSQHRTTGIQE